MKYWYPATMCVNLESIMLSKRSQTQKTTYYIIPFMSRMANPQRQKTD